MSKNSCVIYAPVDTLSGYGSRSRDTVKSIIELKKEEWDIKIIPCAWGNTPIGFIDENPEWHFLIPYLDRKSTRLNSSHSQQSRMPSSA